MERDLAVNYRGKSRERAPGQTPPGAVTRRSRLIACQPSTIQPTAKAAIPSANNDPIDPPIPDVPMKPRTEITDEIPRTAAPERGRAPVR